MLGNVTALMFNLQVLFYLNQIKKFAFLGTLSLTKKLHFYIQHTGQPKDAKSEILRTHGNHTLQCFNFTDGEKETTKIILLLQPILSLLRYNYVWYVALFNENVCGCKYVFVHTHLPDWGKGHIFSFFFSIKKWKVPSGGIGLNTIYNELNGQHFSQFSPPVFLNHFSSLFQSFFSISSLHINISPNSLD